CVPDQQATHQPTVPSEHNIFSDSTSDKPPLQLIEVLTIPTGFSIDSIQYVDEGHKISYQMEIPVSKYPGHQRWIDMKLDEVKKELEARADRATTHLKKSLSDDPLRLEAALARGYSFDLHPQSVYQDALCVSLRFLGTWYEGGPHGLSQYYTFNFDPRTETEVQFETYFQLISAQDSQQFIALVNKGFQNPNLALEEFYPFDFNIEQDSVSFNFDTYELGPYALGMPRSYLGKAKLSQWTHH
ncbi:MAG: hypothetical protein AAFR59_13295, partial [Bacteroidota bacterium]